MAIAGKLDVSARFWAGRFGFSLLAVILVASCSSSGPGAPSGGSPTATQGSGAAATTGAQSSASGLTVVKTFVLTNGDGPVEIVVSVINRGNLPVKLGAAETFTLLAKDGSQLATGKLVPMPQYLAPGDNGYLGGWTTDVAPAGIANVGAAEPHLSATEVGAIPQSLTNSQDTAIKADAANHAYATGSVKNTGSATDATGIVCVVLLDGSGNPLGWLEDDHTLPGLASGGSATFRADAPALPGSLVDAVMLMSTYAFDLESN